MDNHLQNAIENLIKTLDFQLPKFDLINSNTQIYQLNDLGNKLTNEIDNANQNIGEHLRRASELGNNLKSITESFQLGSLTEQLQNNIRYLRVKGNIDSSAGINTNYLDNCIFLDDQYNGYDICLN